MPNERAILCGEAKGGSLPFGGSNPLKLRLWGRGQNVTLEINDIQNHLLKSVPSVFHDLVEIATYVYVADQAVSRGGAGVDNFGENWRRRLTFCIPVRNPEMWKSTPVHDALVETLSFLSEDEYTFDFIKMTKEPPMQGTLEFRSDAPEEVALFSGGLDSVAGAVQEAVIDKRCMTLVTHKPTMKLNRRHRKLEELLREKAEHDPFHIGVKINKSKGLNKEYTQRSRSFLYASLAATVAGMYDLARIRFYENGVVSLNLPPSAQVVGARATRTTHPQTLNGFAKLFSLLADTTFTVENPFLWKTKTEVLELLSNSGCSELIKFATSCTHTWEMTKLHTHCGTCSQCIDRRFAVLAANQGSVDPSEAYKVDLLIGERDSSESRTMLASYVETANEITGMTPLQFFGRFGEASRVLGHLNGSPDTVAVQIFELHQRHARSVGHVVDHAISSNAAAIRKRKLPESCLLRLVCDSSVPGPGPTPIPTQKEDKPGNYIGLKGQCWAIRFGDKEERIYVPDIGFRYLQMLLDHPGSMFSASQLDIAVRRQANDLDQRSAESAELTHENSIMVGKTDAGDIMDSDYRRACTLRLQEINEKLAILQESEEATALDEIEELEKEKTWIDSVQSAAKGKGGRNRKLGDDRNKVRNRVCNNIRRVLKKIEQFDGPLASHLKKPILNLGHTISYVPRDGTKWDTSAIESD